MTKPARRARVSSPRRETATVAQVDVVTTNLAATRHRLYPGAERWLRYEVTKALTVGTLDNPDDVRRSAAAVVAAAAEMTRSKSLGVRDMKRGWEALRGPGNCPPHRCFFSTVVERADEVSQQFPLFERLAGPSV